TQVFTITVQPALVLTELAFVSAQFAPVLANVAIAERIVAIAEVATQVFAITSQLEFVLAELAFIFAQLPAVLLQPVDAVGQLLPVNALVGPALDRLAQTISKWRIAWSARYTTVF